MRGEPHELTQGEHAPQRPRHQAHHLRPLPLGHRQDDARAQDELRGHLTAAVRERQARAPAQVVDRFGDRRVAHQGTGSGAAHGEVEVVHLHLEQAFGQR